MSQTGTPFSETQPGHGAETDDEEGETEAGTDEIGEPVDLHEDGDQEVEETEQETVTAEGATDSDTEVDGASTTNGALATKSNSSESDGSKDTIGTIGDKPDIMSTEDDNSVVVPMRLDREEYDQLREFLQVDDDDPETLAESVHDQLRNLYPTLKTS